MTIKNSKQSKGLNLKRVGCDCSKVIIEYR